MLGDENVANSKQGSLEADFAAWTRALWQDVATGSRSYQLSGDSDEEEEEEEEDEEEAEDVDAVDAAGSGGEEGGLVDMEDMGTFMKAAKVRDW